MGCEGGGLPRDENFGKNGWSQSTLGPFLDVLTTPWTSVDPPGLVEYKESYKICIGEIR